MESVLDLDDWETVDKIICCWRCSTHGMVWRSFLFTRPPSIETERIMLTNQRELPHRANYRRKNKKRTERRRNENVRVNNGKIKRESQTKRVCGMVSVEEEERGRGAAWIWMEEEVDKVKMWIEFLVYVVVVVRTSTLDECQAARLEQFYTL